MRLLSRRPTDADRLRAVGIGVHFEGVRALDQVELQLSRGEILGLIGPNGAGKTTLVNVLSGFQRPSHGQVLLDDADVTRRSPQVRARQGVVRTFQAVRRFSDLSVFENVELGAVGVGIPPREARQVTAALLERLGLEHRAGTLAASLPHGDEHRLGLARALAARPGFLLLDEPAAGLNDAESDELVEVLRAIPGEFGCGVLLIEHEMRVIMSCCQRLQVLDYGKTISMGTPDEVRNDPAVLAAYLGTKEAVARAGG